MKKLYVAFTNAGESYFVNDTDDLSVFYPVRGTFDHIDIANTHDIELPADGAEMTTEDIVEIVKKAIATGNFDVDADYDTCYDVGALERSCEKLCEIGEF